MKLHVDILAEIKDDLDFTQKLLDEEAVFVLPGQVLDPLNLLVALRQNNL